MDGVYVDFYLLTPPAGIRKYFLSISIYFTH